MAAAGEVNLSRLFRIAQLVRKQAPTRRDWESSFERSPLDNSRLNKLRDRLELTQLGSELNGRLVNLYA